jgi:hypothetical protein
MIEIALNFVCYSRKGVTATTITNPKKFAQEFKIPTLIASPILGVNPTKSSYAMNIIGKKKKPHELVAIEIWILSVYLVAKVKKMKLIIVIVIEIIAARFKTEIEFLVCYIFIIMRQKNMLPGIPRPVNSIP